jgi:ribosomal 30S subunit maturation factor RimM
VFAKRTELKDLEDGVYYVADLIGLTLIVGEKEVGKITEILSLKTDVITVSTLDGKILRFPFLKDLQAKVNFESKTFAVLEERFNQVVCYEN